MSMQLNFLRQLSSALRFVWESSPTWMVTSSGLFLIRGMFPLFTLYLMKLLVDAITRSLSTPDKPVTFDHVLVLIILLGAISLLSSICSVFAELAFETQAHVVTDHMQDILHAKSLEVDLEYYENAQ